MLLRILLLLLLLLVLMLVLVKRVDTAPRVRTPLRILRACSVAASPDCCCCCCSASKALLLPTVLSEAQLSPAVLPLILLLRLRLPLPLPVLLLLLLAVVLVALRGRCRLLLLLKLLLRRGEAAGDGIRILYEGNLRSDGGRCLVLLSNMSKKRCGIGKV
jgi:hypothetical protein